LLVKQKITPSSITAFFLDGALGQRVRLKMALPAEFSLLHSEFNGFLFAPIGDQTGGQPLSVLSALTRLGMDPWREAARLSNLPKDLAVAELSGSINRLPRKCWQQSDTQGIAARLIELLPHRGGGVFAATPPATLGPTKRAPLPIILWAIVLALGAAVFLQIAMSGDPPWRSAHVSRSAPSSQLRE
jgi:hypothetical protein